MIRSLYSVGFFGVFDGDSNTFLFCHDGKKPDVNLELRDKVLIHPCYWMALGLSRNSLNADEAAQINDEYEIKVSSVTPAIRNARLGKIISELTAIDFGLATAGDFERWALEASKISFAGRLDNLELHPNRGSTNQRDIVGTNLGNSPFWKRVREDYGVRQVIFEVKNFEELTQENYRQLMAYMSGPYGNLAFFIDRSEAKELEKDRELAWVRSIYNDHKKIIMKLPGKFFAQLLSKQRNPQKHDIADVALASLLDTYERNYLGQPSGRKKRGRN